ncbi:MAG: ribosome biogenesis GTPase Der [Deltaproteobacteria bacterium]|nr:ribosome biogenesis GTPase Der [Deltaproteobacteria bacterium]
MAIVAIVGRPNVGKSTLFNRLGRRNRALVFDAPGVTRDRNYALVSWEDKSFTLVDTGGFVQGEASVIEKAAREQILMALDEADAVLFVLDAKAGLTPEDTNLADLLRKSSKSVFCAVNKIDGPEQESLVSDFYALGFDRCHAVSAAHGYGIEELMSRMTRQMPAASLEGEEEEEPFEIRIAVIGRPNVGKSTLVNQILRAPRVIVSPLPGTTRDPVDTPFSREGQRYVLIDTAGIRRKGKTIEGLEKLGVLRALQSIERSHISILLLDATEGITDQDLHIAGYIQDRHRACLIGINKWDAVENDPRMVKSLREDVRARFRFFPFAPVLAVSAMTGKKVNRILPTVQEIFQQYNHRVTTGLLNRALEDSLRRHEPPTVRGRSLKFYYATQASTRPPTFVLFCNYPDAVHFSYERYLINQLRDAFGLDKTPIRILFRGRQRKR